MPNFLISKLVPGDVVYVEMYSNYPLVKSSRSAFEVFIVSAPSAFSTKSRFIINFVGRIIENKDQTLRIVVDTAQGLLPGRCKYPEITPGTADIPYNYIAHLAKITVESGKNMQGENISFTKLMLVGTYG